VGIGVVTGYAVRQWGDDVAAALDDLADAAAGR